MTIANEQQGRSVTHTAESCEPVKYYRVETSLEQPSREVENANVILDNNVDAEFEEVDMESVQYHCEATIMPNNGGQQPVKRGAMLDSASEVSYASETLATKLGAHFDGT